MITSKPYIFTLIWLTLTTTAISQPLSQKLDTYFQQVKTSSLAPGFSVVIVKGKDIIFSKGYGQEIAGQKKPMTPQTVSAIGSLTKSFTALAMMQLVEEGKVKLDEPVKTYLPNFKTANPERSDKITVRMLLNNSSGIYGGVSQKWQDPNESLEKLMQSLEAIYLKKEPGTSYEYSNAAFSVAGLIISRVSGLSYPEYIRQHILKPLGMKHSSTDPQDFERLKALQGHQMGMDCGIPAVSGFDSYEMIPAGSMFRSSAEDLGNYLIALLNEGRFENQQIIQLNSLKLLWEPQTSFPGLTKEMGGDGSNYFYALGWMISEVEGRKFIHHGGSTGTMSSMTMLYPEKQLAASILFNVDYNFLDPYQCPSEFSILNNAFNLIEGLPMSDFGNPRRENPTLNQYELVEGLFDRYIGTYRFSGKGDTRNYFGVNLVISRNKEGKLIGQTFRGKQLLTDFILDFTNEAVALSRNIGVPKTMRFNIRPDGKITGLFFSDSEFQKQPDDFLDDYQWVNVFDPETGFYFPKNWKWVKQAGYFQAIQNDKPENIFLAGMGEKESLETLFNNHFSNHQLTYQGKQNTEIRGSEVWQSLSVVSKREGKNFQHLILMNETSGFWGIFSTPFGELTVAGENVELLMDSFR